MKIIEQQVELINQGPTWDDMIKHIELCGRISYKSEDKITEDSAQKFVDMIIKNGHCSVLEHGTIYLKLPSDTKDWLPFWHNPYSKIAELDGHVYITTNYRVVIEIFGLEEFKKRFWNYTYDREKIESKETEQPKEQPEDDMFGCLFSTPSIIKKPLYKVIKKFTICKTVNITDIPEDYRRYTIKFTTDRGISHELVRHRVFSFTQESSRYCNYSKNKFGNELTFIRPYWIESGKEDSVYNLFQKIEDMYNTRINDYAPQAIRAILPNAIKTEIVMTGFLKDWKQFVELRTTKAAHPQMQEVALKVKELLNI